MAKAADRKKNGSAYHNLRFERKFIYTDTFVGDVINNEVLINGFGFKEVFYRRTVNNIYFDDWNHTFYKMNVSGDGKREKYRLRWYGDDFYELANPTLEIKKKLGEVGDKYSHKLKDFAADLRVKSVDDLHSSLKASVKNDLLRAKLDLLFPTLYNSYERRYFLSECGKFRITIDFNMKFYNPNCTPFYLSKCELEDIILELKYNREDDIESREITQALEARLSKNSKYIRGYDILKGKS